MRSFSAIAFIVCGTFLFISGSIASASPLSIRVAVDISADQDLKATLSSYLLRELRELPNVIVVDEKADWKLHIVSFQNATTSGQPTGYTIAIAITSPEDLESDRLALNTSFSPSGQLEISDKSWESVKDIFENKEDYVSLWLRTLGTTSLRDECARLIADFDSKYLEPRRKSHQKLLDRVNESRKKKGLPPLDN